jgi:hypothetical protein
MIKQIKRINFSATDEESGATYDLVAQGDTDTEAVPEGTSLSIHTATGQNVRTIAKGKYQIEGVFGPVELTSDDPNAP